MADRQFYTREAAIAKATDIKTALATGKLRLIDAALLPAPNEFTTRVQLLAAEATFDGYTAGGYSVAAWTGPDANAAGGAKLTSALVRSAYGPAGTPPVTNSISGWWYDDATAITPLVRVVGVYDPHRPMAQVGDAIIWVDQIVEGMNPPPA